MLVFGFTSVVLRYDNEIELPLNLSRISREFNITNIVFLSTNDRQEKTKDLFFKVNSKKRM